MAKKNKKQKTFRQLTDVALNFDTHKESGSVSSALKTHKTQHNRGDALKMRFDRQTPRLRQEEGEVPDKT